jgi:tetratricopeptide (TPR) repeat protein
MLQACCRTIVSLLMLSSIAGPAVADASAKTFCPGNSGEPLPPAAEMAALADSLAGYENACNRDPGYLAYRGAVLLQLGRMEAAAALLERALLIAPERAGAQADYARALAALGDERGAQSLIDNLLARNDVPGGLRATLQDWQRFIGRDLATVAWQTGGSLTLRAGHESNLNSAPAHSSLDLTLPDGTVNLPLDKSYRAQGGGAMLAEASLQAGRNLQAGGRLQLLADIRSRHASVSDKTDYRQYEAIAVLTLPVAGVAAKAANQFSLGASRLDYGGEQLYEAQRLGLARVLQAGRCLSGGSLDAEIRHYPTSGNLDGKFLGLGGSLRCPVGDARISLIARIGHDRADSATRPGGNQQRLDLRLAYTRPIAGGQLDAELNFGHQSDGAAYSEILEEGARRRLNRLGFRAEWAVPLGKGVEGIATLEAFRQGSNIPLFDIRSTAIWLGGRWTWGS